MARVTIRGIVKTSIVTAFTIAAALIWKDLITEVIEMFVPPESAIFYKFISAVIATIFVIVAIYVILKTESEAEFVMKKLKDGTVKFVKAPPKKSQTNPISSKQL